MIPFTTADIRAAEPCYDPSRYLPEDWTGDALTILRDGRIPRQDRIWVVTNVGGALSVRETSLFLTCVVLPIARRYADDRGAAAIDTVVGLHERRIARDESTGREWSSTAGIAAEAAEAAEGTRATRAALAAGAAAARAAWAAWATATQTACAAAGVAAWAKMVTGLINLLEAEAMGIRVHVCRGLLDNDR